MADDFNSSDIEFEPVLVKGKQKRGQRSIQEIIEHADEDRISSKKAIKSLEFGRGAPGTIDMAQHWVQRFNAFRQSTLRRSIDIPFTGDDVLRFLDTIIGKLRRHSRDKPVPSSEYIVGGFAQISAYGTFTYKEESGYKLTVNDAARLQTWLDDAVKAGRLTKGRWKKKVWLNYTIVSRMTKAWLNHHLRFGARNWDLVIAGLLSIVLVTGVGMRVGDVTRSSAYDGLEYVKYKDIQLKVVGEAKLSNIKARITLSYMKGMKDTLNMDGVFYLRPLEEHTNEGHMCVISVLLIHALRQGMVRGSTLSEVLENAIAAPDSCIIWTFPDRPVLPAIISNKTRRVDLEKPARPDQILRVIKEMGLISNILSPVTLHALRYGNAQDVAHLPRDQTAGFVDDSVRQTLSHAPVTLMYGTTEMYTGAHTRETYKDRAAAQYRNPWGAKFSEASALDAVKGAVSNDEIAEWQRLNEPDTTDHTTRNARDRARAAIRAERHRRFIATAAPERESTAKKGVLSDKSTNVMAGRSTEKKSSSSRELPAPIRPAVSPSRSMELSNIDPRLLEEGDLNNMEVDAVQLKELQDQVLNIVQESHDADKDVNDEASTAMATEALLSGDDPAQQQLSTEYGFIDHYSKINIVNCTRFAEQWAKHQKGASYEDSIGQYSVRGNSRESPTPMQFQCQATARCPYISIHKKAVVAHEALCSPEYVAREVYREEEGEKFRCTQCEEAFLTPHMLKMHVKSIHDFTPVPCPDGCEPDKIYPSQKTLDAHTRRVHSGIWPARCRYPGCDNETEFKSSSYSNHLIKAHQLTTRAARAPFFPPTMKNIWHPTACPVDDCPDSHLHRTKDLLTHHLIKTHKYERKAANKLAECGWVKTLTVDVQESHITRKARPKPWEVGKHEKDGEAEDDDNEEEAENERLAASTKRRKR
jgi:hypothetical protein